MNNKKYEIVRVYDTQCPIEYGITSICSRSGCKNCQIPKRHGLTKQQFVTIIKNSLRRHFKSTSTYTDLAHNIVNDLGIK